MQNEINGYPLHHVGIIFTDFEKTEAFMKVAGLQEEYRGYVDAYQAWCVFLQGNGASKIELIIPLLEERAVPGAGNILVNFMRPRDGYGVLIEFVETIEHP